MKTPTPLAFRPALILLMGILILQGCAALRPHRPPPVRLDPGQVRALLRSTLETQGRVRTFFSRGTVLVMEEDRRSSLRFLALGSQDPFRLRVEISHPWGGPLFYLLLGDSTQQALAFSEKRYYTWKGGLERAPGIFPGPVPLRHLWGLLQGRIVPYRRAEAKARTPGKIALCDQRGRLLQVLSVRGTSGPFTAAAYPEAGLNITLSEFREPGPIPHAETITLKQEAPKRTVRIRLTQVVFNGVIPEPAFMLRPPPGFETVSLDQQGLLPRSP